MEAPFRVARYGWRMHQYALWDDGWKRPMPARQVGARFRAQMPTARQLGAGLRWRATRVRPR